MHDLDANALAVIKRGSLSFSLASLFFSKDQRVAAAQVYWWCRHCDDVIDRVGQNSKALENLKKDTALVWESEEHKLTLPFKALRLAANKYNIPFYYADQLLKGMEMDLKQKQYSTLADLLVYCYRVASTVGLMMCHVMGLFRMEALQQAAKLGMAMQLTNIARDVKEDFEMNRLYLPLDLLRRNGLYSDTYFLKENRPKLFHAVCELINESEKFYEEGLAGIKDLPWRSALAVLIAGKIYREIGRKILRDGTRALEERAVVGTFRKIYLVLISIGEMLIQLPERILRPQQKVNIAKIWSFP